MIVRSTKIWLGLFLTALILIAAVSCEQTETSKLVPPAFFADEALDQAREYVNQGYTLLDSNLVDSAVATFGMIDELIPNGLISNYHTACAYGRSGNIDQAFAHLTKLVEAGYDTPENLKYDGDYESLRSDPRWEALVAQAQKNHEGLAASLANGMPRYDKAPQTFATEEEYDEWLSEQKARIRKNSMAWTSAEQTIARIDLAAQKLACIALIKKDDTTFNRDLERVREAANLSSMYEPWGGVADLVVAEAKSYLNTSPGDNESSETNYKAGLAQAMKYMSGDDKRVTAYAESNKYLEKVAEETEFYPAAQILMLVNNLRLPNADDALLGELLKEAVTNYATDKNAARIIATQYGAETVSHIWPIEIGVEDIDGKLVNVADYKGKVLLIDFWATWCGPCRAELPELLKVYDEYHGKGFEIVSISLDYDDRLGLDKYREWIDEKKMNWRHTYDGQGWDTPLVKKYFVSSIPAPFMVGTDGSLIAFGEDCRGEQLETTVKTALGL